MLRSVQQHLRPALALSARYTRTRSVHDARPWFRPEPEENRVKEHPVYREHAANLHWWDARLGDVVEHFDGTGRRYRIVRKLGYGGGSNAWLAYHEDSEEYVVLKILNSNQSGRTAEPELLVSLFLNVPPRHRDPHAPATDDGRSISMEGVTRAHKGLAYVRGLRGVFMPQRVPDDEKTRHMALVLEPMGESVLDIRPEGRLPLAWTKHVVRQVLAGLAFLHVRGIYHGDVNPRNIMCGLGPDPQRTLADALARDPPPTEQKEGEFMCSRPLDIAFPQTLEDLHVKLVDLSGGDWTDLPEGQRIAGHGEGVWEYRSPEALLGLDVGTPDDIWGLGCFVFEVLTSKFLFGRQYPVGEKPLFTAEHIHLMRMAMHTGLSFPDYMTQSSGGRKYFDEDGEVRYVRSKNPYGLGEALKLFVELNERDLAETVSFMTRCLQLDPQKRASADDLLFDPWLA